MVVESPYEDLVLPETSLSEYVFEYFVQYGDNVALIDNGLGKEVSFSQLLHQVHKCATALKKRGLKKGDIVGICARSCVEYPVILLAVSACGAAVTTCNPDYSSTEILQQFEITRPKIVFADVAALDAVERVANKLETIEKVYVQEKSNAEYETYESLLQSDTGNTYDVDDSIEVKNDIVLIPYSSGTTGLPKGVMHSHYTLIANAHLIGHHFGFVENDCFYMERPMYHGYGYLTLLSCLHRGTKIVFDQRFNAEAMLKAIQTHKVTHLAAVPPIMMGLAETTMHSRYDTSSLRCLACGGAPLAPHLITFVEERYKVIVLAVFAMTECAPVSMSDPMNRVVGSEGTICANTVVKIINPKTGKELGNGEKGEILVKGPHVMMGYHANPEATARAMEGKWLRTGDIGYCNAEKQLYVVGRLKEIIKYKTFQVPPAEIESVLLKHAKISDAAVVGIPDPDAGEVPKAFVVKKNQSLNEEEVKQCVAAELINYKHLRGGVEFVDAIPKNKTGKIDRLQLKKMI